MTKEEMIKRQQQENDSMFEILSKIPVKIYIGTIIPLLILIGGGI
jgi:hypothetical protein